jgi:heme O synthase-like polyprenyltransferase
VFALKPTPETARNLFLASVAYLPILLILLVADRR